MGQVLDYLLFFFSLDSEISYTVYHYHLFANDRCVWKFLYSLCFVTRQNSQLFSDYFLARLNQFCNGLDAMGQIFNYYHFVL